MDGKVDGLGGEGSWDGSRQDGRTNGRAKADITFFREDRGDVGVDAVRATFLVKQGACNRLQDLILPNSDVIGLISLIVFKF